MRDSILDEPTENAGAAVERPVAVDSAGLLEAIAIVMACSERRGQFTVGEMAVLADARNVIKTCGQRSLERMAKARRGNGQ